MQESIEQIDPTEELTIETVKKRAVRGAAILTGRNVLIQGISFFAIALLTVFLAPSEFGVFFIVSAITGFLAYFGDIGFAASLIQKKNKLTDIELNSVFTFQQILIISLLIIVFLFTPLIQNFYNLTQEAVYLLWALSVSLLLSSLKTIPTVLMERKLEFNKYVVPQIAETIAFNVTAVTLAWNGYGVTSFTIAVLIRGFLGLIITYLIQPWMPGVAFSLNALKSVLKFGVPYQANTLLAMVKDDGMILFLGSILGTTGVGLLGWAQKWAYAPLRFFMDQVIKVTFPAFSRLQDNKKELSNAVTKSIFFICMLTFPSLVFLVIVAPSLVEIIPKYEKWTPALGALTILSITSAVAAFTTPLTNTLNAIGRITLTFKLMVMWTILTWVLVPALAVSFGVTGAAIGFTLVGSSSIVALILVSKYVDINYFQSVGKPFLAASLMGGLVLLVRSVLEVSLLQVSLMGLLGFISFAGSILILEKRLFGIITNQCKILFKK